MNFQEASEQPEGTLFNVIDRKTGGGWLNCYFKDGIVRKQIGDKLAASKAVFEANWEIVGEENWNLAHNIAIPRDVQEAISKCRDLILKDIGKTNIRIGHMILVQTIVQKRFGDLK